QNQSGRVELSNGMTASTGGVPVTPYLRAALTQELAKGGTVRINDRYDFADDFAGSGARASAYRSRLPRRCGWTRAGRAASAASRQSVPAPALKSYSDGFF
ncbi:hypothetical protein, partial [Type-E symbiont of Plautia stali]|uniref:hypothetical protein n=1 Tax=Type-E symbiont of Plautia stali TaxID=1560357 RepID=UPI000B094419